MVEHSLGKGEVESSILSNSTTHHAGRLSPRTTNQAPTAIIGSDSDCPLVAPAIIFLMDVAGLIWLSI